MKPFIKQLGSTAAIFMSLILVAQTLIYPSWAVDPMDFGVPVHELRPTVQDVTKTEVLESSDIGTKRLVNATYKDLPGSVYNPAVTRLSALGVMNKKGTSSYSASKTLTGNEALAYLVDLAGRGPTVKARIDALTSGLNAERTKLITNDQYLAEARTLGLVTLKEEQTLKNPVSREMFGSWLSKAAALTPAATSLESVAALKDGASIDPTYKSIVETLINDGVMLPDQNGNFNPKRAITKGEMASAMDNALGKMTTAGIQSDFGLIIGKNTKVDNSGGKSVTSTEWVVKKADGKLVKIRTSLERPSMKATDFVVNKGGTTKSSSALAIGDEIEYLIQNSKVTFARKIDSNTILSKANEDMKKMTGLTYMFGIVGDKRTEKQWDGTAFVLTTRLRIQNYDGETADFVVQNNQAKGLVNDVLVVRKGKVGGIETLQKGDKIEYLIKGDSEVVYALLKPFTSVVQTGNVRNIAIDATTGHVNLTIYDYKNQIRQYPLAPYAHVFFGAAPGTSKDLKLYQDITATVTNGYITDLKIGDSAENGGYIPENGKIRMGTVLKQASDGLQVTLDSGELLPVVMDGSTKIIKDGQPIPKASIKEGDAIKIYYSIINTTTASRVEIESKVRPVKQLYKGQLADVDLTSGNMVLSNVSYLKNNVWTTDDSYKKEIAINGATSLYYNDNKITPEALYKEHKGDIIYAVVEDSYGTDQGVKVNVKRGGEMTYYDRIAQLDQTQKSMELVNNTNIGISDGTIIVKDGRVIPRQNLNIKDNVLVVAGSNTGGQFANIVSVVTKADNVFTKIVVGTIDKVNPNTFTMNLTSQLAMDNQWSTVSTTATQPFTLNNDSVIYDLTAGKNLTATDLFHGKYGKSENTESPYSGLYNKRYYAYLVLDENNQVLAMNIRKKGFLASTLLDDITYKETELPKAVDDTIKTMQLSRGIYDSADTTWSLAKMTGTYDWSAIKNQWMAMGKDTYVKYDSAVIIKNGKPIKYTDLQQGDQLYVVRNGTVGLIIIVESN